MRAPSRLRDGFLLLQILNRPVAAHLYVSLLQEALKTKNLSNAKLVHAHMIEKGFVLDDGLWKTLLHAYVACPSLHCARRVFNQMPTRNAFSWTVLISAYVKHGFAEEALSLFHQMQKTDVQSDEFTFASVIPACTQLAALQQGMVIHGQIIRSGFQSDVFVAGLLIDMYAKCGKIEEIREVFDQIPQRDVVVWNSLIAGYALSGYVHEALKIFEVAPQRDVLSWNTIIGACAKNGAFEEASALYLGMRRTGVLPDHFTYASILPAVVSLGQGMVIHGDMIKSGLRCDVFLTDALIEMYVKWGDMEKARNVFDKMPHRDVVSWNSIIGGYAQWGKVDEAACLFQEMPKRDLYSWNTMITAYSEGGPFEVALGLYLKMQKIGVQPDHFTFASVLRACAKLASLKYGKGIHEHIINSGYQSDVFVATGLIDMYAKCGDMEKARYVFDKMPQRDVASWNAIIGGYAQNGQIDEAVNVFSDAQDRDVISWNIIIAGFDKSGLPQVALMVFSGLHRKGIQLNEFIFKSVLTACSRMSALEQGMQIHANIIKCGVNMLMTACSFLKIPSTKYGLVSLRLLLMPRMVLFKEAYEPSMTYEGH
ncbi:pentatricopeptide repeat-containing protein At2g13600 [Cryptomeria japonica]|uniref:pentatricopeptide repeat-containing protein At2g13600 n=1 Tax=Cryptomeria japonica TaxID=3369 RepID=UPI0027DA1A60|nr:pentatricopeptide repeat-containing protein At2g13600 [Cryptomeria japonica]